MILRRRTVELLTANDIPPQLWSIVDRVLVLDGLPCTAIATRESDPMVMAVGGNRAVALRRLCERLTGTRRGARRWVPRHPGLPGAPAPR